MPLKLIPPRKGKSPHISIRGTYLGIYVDKSCRTDRRHVARTQLEQLERAIERGEYPAKEAVPRDGQPTFLAAALAYMEAGRRRRYVAKLIRHFGTTITLAEIDQAAIDAGALAAYPKVKPQTRNTCFYTPVSAILRHAGIKMAIRRPKDAKGRIVTDYLSESDAGAIIHAAESLDVELGLLLRFLLYTGVRLGEALALRWDDVQLGERFAWIKATKNGDPRSLLLREDLVAGLKAHEAKAPQPPGRVFRFHQGGHLKHQLVRAKLKALGLKCPTRRPTGWRLPRYRLAWVNFHTFRHTWATWMRQHGGADLQGLVGTGNWRDARSAARYAHVVPREEWRRVEMLPAIGGKSVVKARDAS